MGAADDERSMTIAHECDITVFSVDYRLAPEQPFPRRPERLLQRIVLAYEGGR
jgi:acetyl esterase/lipase